MAARFDHLAFAAADLPSGVAWFEQVTGVSLPPGGAHPRMGTHNHVAAMDGSSYLEMIAVDPAGAASRMRWFGLDLPQVQVALLDAPRLHTWVVAVDDLDAAIETARAVGIDYGTAIDMTRGDLQWRFAVTDTGAMPLDGAAPQLIQWPGGPHVAGKMAQSGLQLEDLSIATTDAARLLRLLKEIGLREPRITVVPATKTVLSATFSRADGQKISVSRAASAAQIEPV